MRFGAVVAALVVAEEGDEEDAVLEWVPESDAVEGEGDNDEGDGDGWT